MSEQVNLLQEVREVKKEKNRLFSLSFLFLLLTIIVSVVLLLLMFYLKTEEGGIANSQIEGSQSIAQFENKKILHQSVKERLSTVSKLLQNRNVLTDRFLGVIEIIPKSVDLTSVDISGNSMKISLSSTSLIHLNDFLEKNLKKLPVDADLKVKRVQIDSAGVQTINGTYLVGVTIEFL